MPLFEITSDDLTPIQTTTFAEIGVTEKKGLQRLLRQQIDALVDDVLIIAEEFGDWDDSNRRIDLLGVDRNADLVVIELKRTEDGGHLELQSIRYAAMVSTLTFEEAVQIYEQHLQDSSSEIDAREKLVDFFGWEDDDGNSFGRRVRIVLAAADFSKEVMTTVMWLIHHDLDIRCFRLRPYRHEGRTLLDIQQALPLPEAEEYLVRASLKDREVALGNEKGQIKKTQLRQFWTRVLNRAKGELDLHAGVGPSVVNWLAAGSGVTGLGFNYVVKQYQWRVELYIDRGHGYQELNKQRFQFLRERKDKIEDQFDGTLEWDDGGIKQYCRITTSWSDGGYRSSESNQAEFQSNMVDAMKRLHEALEQPIQQLKTMDFEMSPASGGPDEGDA